MNKSECVAAAKIQNSSDSCCSISMVEDRKRKHAIGNAGVDRTTRQQQQLKYPRDQPPPCMLAQQRESYSHKNFEQKKTDQQKALIKMLGSNVRSTVNLSKKAATEAVATRGQENDDSEAYFKKKDDEDNESEHQNTIFADDVNLHSYNKAANQKHMLHGDDDANSIDAELSEENSNESIYNENCDNVYMTNDGEASENEDPLKCSNSSQSSSGSSKNYMASTRKSFLLKDEEKIDEIESSGKVDEDGVTAAPPANLEPIENNNEQNNFATVQDLENDIGNKSIAVRNGELQKSAYSPGALHNREYNKTSYWQQQLPPDRNDITIADTGFNKNADYDKSEIFYPDVKEEKKGQQQQQSQPIGNSDGFNSETVTDDIQCSKMVRECYKNSYQLEQDLPSPPHDSNSFKNHKSSITPENLVVASEPSNISEPPTETIHFSSSCNKSKNENVDTTISAVDFNTLTAAQYSSENSDDKASLRQSNMQNHHVGQQLENKEWASGSFTSTTSFKESMLNEEVLNYHTKVREEEKKLLKTVEDQLHQGNSDTLKHHNDAKNTVSFRMYPEQQESAESLDDGMPKKLLNENQQPQTQKESPPIERDNITFHSHKDLLLQKEDNIKNHMNILEAFPPHMQQCGQQTQHHRLDYQQHMLLTDREQLNKHQHSDSHFHQQLKNRQKQFGQFAEEQLYQQQQQQHEQQQQGHLLHPDHSINYVLNSQMQSQIHLQQTFLHQQQQNQFQQAQQYQQQQLLNPQDNRAHLMTYLHQEQQHRQQQQLEHYQQQQQQGYQEQLNNDTVLTSSTHSVHTPLQSQHHYQQQQQDMNKFQVLATTVGRSKSNQLSNIDELMLDEYHDEHNVEYKLNLSPTHVKHENKDDGYETSAGDLLTPSSHSASTHSLTPQHQMQHQVNLLPRTKREEQEQQKTNQQQISESIHQQQQQRSIQDIQASTSMNQEVLKDNATNSTADAYNFIEDEISAATNLNMRPSPSESVYMGITNVNAERQCLPIAAIPLQQQQQTQSISVKNNQQQQQTDGLRGNSSSFSYICTDQQQDMLKDDISLLSKPPQKRRGRKKKLLTISNLLDGIPNSLQGPDGQNLKSNECDSAPASGVPSAGGVLKSKERKKHDKFNGMSEEEVAKRELPDHLCDNLDIVIVGINPGLFAAYKGHHYAGPGNHFWKCLFLSGLTNEQMSAEEDYKLMKYGIGFTNMVKRATKGSADLTRKEIKEGSRILLDKLQTYRPKIAVFNGKLIFEVFSGKKDFNFGRQPECVEGTDTYVWVMPSSSARCAQLPRAADKVPFYAALKKFRDYINGVIPHIDESECVFTEQKIKQCCELTANNVMQDGVGPEPPTQNATSQQHHANGGISQLGINNSTMQQKQQNFESSQQQSYMYPNEQQARVASIPGHTPGPGPPHMSSIEENRYVLPNCLVTQQLPEKKKRGRPKKIKEIMRQDIIDSVTGNKIQVASNQIPTENDFNNILNLSMMTGAAGSIQVPKKKRGRPKKVKLSPDLNIPQTLQQHPFHQQPQQPKNLICESTASPQQQHASIFNTPPPQHFDTSPPMHSPTINCSYAPPKTTRKSQTHGDSNSPDLLVATNQLEKNSYFAEKLMQSSPESSAASSPHVRSHIHQQIALSSPSTKGIAIITPELIRVSNDSPTTNSPNISSVGFEPSELNLTRSSTHHQPLLDSSVRQQHVPTKTIHQDERSSYGSPTQQDSIADENQQQTHQSFNQWMSPQHNLQRQDYNHHQAHQQHLIQYHDQQMVQLQQQQTMDSQWQRQQLQHKLGHRFDDSASSYMPHNAPLHQVAGTANDKQTQELTVSEHVHISNDLASKSLSGLESLVDQIPTISESETAIINTLSASAAAAVENRLQSIQLQVEINASQQQQQHNVDSGAEVSEAAQSHLYCAPTSHTPNGGKNVNSEALASGGGSGSTTPHTVNNAYGSGSPANRLNSSASVASSPISHASLRSPQQHYDYTQQLFGQHQYSAPFTPSHHEEVLTQPTSANSTSNSPPTTPAVLAVSRGSNLFGTSNGSNSSPSTLNVHSRNFSVSRLAASSAIPSFASVPSTNYPPGPTNHAAAYHHTNLMAVAALAAAAANSPSPAATTSSAHTPPHTQIYMDPHVHLSLPANTMYPHSHSHSAHHHHHAYAVPPQSSIQHSPAADYDITPYNSPSAAASLMPQSTGVSQPPHQSLHTLHIPSPNYPYGYATPPTQAGFTNAAAVALHGATGHLHQSTPPPPGAVSAAAVAGYQHTHHHHHPHHHHPPPHHPHLTMFERIKPSDIGSYGNF